MVILEFLLSVVIIYILLTDFEQDQKTVRVS